MNSKDLGVDLNELTNFEKGVQQGRSDPLGTVASWFSLPKGSDGSGSTADTKTASARQSKPGPMDGINLRELKLILEKIISDKPLTADEKNFLRSIYNKI